MATNQYIVVASLLTSIALALVFLAMLLFYRRARESFRGRAAELLDVTNRLDAEMQRRAKIDHDLAESQLRFRQMVESLPVGVLITDRNGVFTYANEAAARMFRTATDRIVGLHYAPQDARWKLVGPAGGPLRPEENPFARVLSGCIAVENAEHLFLSPSGAIVHLSITAAPLLSTNGKLRGVVASIRDVTDLARTREELEVQKSFFEQMFLQSSVATQIFDRSGMRLSANTEWCRLFGTTAIDAARRPYNIFEDRALIGAGMIGALKRVVGEGATVEQEVQIEPEGAGNHSMRWFRIRAHPIWDTSGAVTNMVVHYDDATERRLAEETMRHSLQEKELLLKEVHHRVKNNMQLMKSLLSLQAGNVHDPETLAILNDSESRISTMALIHEKLYQSAEFGSIDLRSYLTYVVDNLYQTYVHPGAAIEIETAFDAVVVDLDTAIPCGLLANELVSNAMKHAFKGRPGGTVAVSFRACPPGGDEGHGPDCELIVQDNGAGIPEEARSGRNDSLGLKLVSSLVRQLEGEMRVETGPDSGTTISVVFPCGGGTVSTARGVQ